jgi:hypothetical protein
MVDCNRTGCRLAGSPFSVTGQRPDTASPAAPPRTTLNAQINVFSQSETHVVLCCGHDVLRDDDAAATSSTLSKLEAFSHVDSQQARADTQTKKKHHIIHVLSFWTLSGSLCLYKFPTQHSVQ